MLVVDEIAFPASVLDHEDDVPYRRHVARMRRQYDALLPLLDSCNTMLSIGCGLAVLEAMLCTALDVRYLTLVDGRGRGDAPKNGYTEVSHPWSDVERGRAVVLANAPAVDVRAIHPENDLGGPYDLLVSFRSWCHHYPANAYLDVARRCRTVVVDVRRGSGNLQILENVGFCQARRVEDPSVKCDRIILRNSQCI